MANSISEVAIKGPVSHAYGRINVKFKPPSPERDSGPGRSNMSPPAVALGGEAIGIMREILHTILISKKSATIAVVKSIADANKIMIAAACLRFFVSKAPVFDSAPINNSIVPA